MEPRREPYNPRSSRARTDGGLRSAIVVAGSLVAGALAGVLAARALIASRSEAARREQSDIAALAERIRALEARLDTAQDARASPAPAARTGVDDGARGRDEGAAADAGGESRPWEDDVADLRREVRALKVKVGAELLGGVSLAGEMPDAFDLSLLEKLDAHDEASNEGAAPYSAEQVIGEPDTRTSGDSPRSWCPGAADAGTEWIDVTFARRETPIGVIVREHYTPGAVAKIDARDARGRSRTVWEGEDPTRANPGSFVVFIEAPFPTSELRVWLDTSRRTGWTEVDAIGLLTDDGILWAASARASSTWISGGGGGGDQGSTPITVYHDYAIRRMLIEATRAQAEAAAAQQEAAGKQE